LSQERILRILACFGLTRTDIKVYISLAKKGPQKGEDLRNSLNMQKQQLYPSLKSLQSKGVVTATIERPAIFSALPFEKVLDLLIKTNIEKAEHMIHSKEKLLSNWRSMTPNNSEE
jgi:sugar-specific transcriptional regulator TrmB